MSKVFRRVARALANLEGEYNLDRAEPQFCLHLLDVMPTLKVLNKLHRKLHRTSSKEWIIEFVQLGGLFTLLRSVDRFSHAKSTSDTTFFNSLILSKIICCIKELLNVKYAMDAIIELANENQSRVKMLAMACLNPNQVVKKEIFQIFSAIAMYSEDGYALCMNMLDAIKRENLYHHRFTILINELKNNLNTSSYLAVIVGFINCLISQPEELKDRLAIKFELNSMKINEILSQLKQLMDEDLSIQIEMFEKFQREDEDEAFSQTGFDLNNPIDLFNAIALKTDTSKNTSQKLLELLQVLFQIIDDGVEKKPNSPTMNKIETILEVLASNAREMASRGRMMRVFSSTSTQTVEEESKSSAGDIGMAVMRLKKVVRAPVAPNYPPPPPPPVHPPSETPPLPPRRNPPKKVDSVVIRDVSPDINLPPPPPPPPTASNHLFSSAPLPPPPPPPIPQFLSSTVPLPPPPPPPLPTNGHIQLTPTDMMITVKGTSSSTPPISDLLSTAKARLKPIAESPHAQNNLSPVSAATVTATATSTVKTTVIIPPAPPLPQLNIPPPPPPPMPQLIATSNTTAPLPPPPPPPPPFNLMSSATSSSASLSSGSSIGIMSPQNDNKTIYKTLPKSTKPLKNFGWQKVPSTALNKESLWKEVNEKQDDIKLDFSALEDLFVKTTNPIIPSAIVKPTVNNTAAEIDRKISVRKLNAVESSHQVVSILDAKQNMNINVYLKKIKVPLDEFIKMIINGRSRDIGLDNLSCLKKILPEKSDVDNIQAYCEANPSSYQQTLGKAENFIKLLTDIPNYALRIDLMNYLEEFDEIFSRIRQPLEVYSKSSRVILTSETIKSFLRLVLAAGNFINMNSYNGQAVGFKISVLPKLIEIKTNKPGISFLHAIVEQFGRDFDFVDELKDLSLISNNNLANLSNDFKMLKKKTIELKEQMKEEYVSNDVRLQFLDQLNACNYKVDELEHSLNEIDDLKLKLIDYYTEDSLTFDLDEFLKNFHDLCLNITKAKEDNKNRTINEEKVIRRKKELTEMEEKRKSLNAKTDVHEEEGDVLNSLLSNLKSGKVQRQSIRRSVMIQPQQIEQPNNLNKHPKMKPIEENKTTIEINKYQNKPVVMRSNLKVNVLNFDSREN